MTNHFGHCSEYQFSVLRSPVSNPSISTGSTGAVTLLLSASVSIAYRKCRSQASTLPSGSPSPLGLGDVRVGRTGEALLRDDQTIVVDVDPAVPQDVAQLPARRNAGGQIGNAAGAVLPQVLKGQDALVGLR